MNIPCFSCLFYSHKNNLHFDSLSVHHKEHLLKIKLNLKQKPEPEHSPKYAIEKSYIEGQTQIFVFWAKQLGQIFLAGYFWAVKSPHKWQHMCFRVKMENPQWISIIIYCQNSSDNLIKKCEKM